MGGSGNIYFSPCDQTANSNQSLHVEASQRAQPAFRMAFSSEPSFRLGKKNKTAFSIFRQVCTIVSHKTGVTMTGSCFCIGIHSRAVRGRTEEWGGYRGEKKWCTFHLYYVRDFYSARPLCWERPTRGSFYSHDSSFASIICFPLQIAALQVGCLL